MQFLFKKMMHKLSAKWEGSACFLLQVSSLKLLKEFLLNLAIYTTAERIIY